MFGMFSSAARLQQLTAARPRECGESSTM
ncbi:MAG: hypothetical protein KDA80_22395 [Planctomycetaceae bacterium]|nr:hypothetical protein [Planctomycetaceae bacterium]